ncbi:MAG: hypothetical protein KatS3mg113_0279 [Planctomycetaceae bacterium]|nr:MAG: hypothetical protein KatS3mg113_0279 [Planctomycetaceae bacterium]
MNEYNTCQPSTGYKAKESYEMAGIHAQAHLVLWLLLGVASYLGDTGRIQAADIISRRNGTRVSGRITSVSATEVVVKPPTGDPVTVPGNEIVAIEWNDAPVQMRLALADENGGRFEAALQKLSQCKADVGNSPDTEALRLELDFLMARVAARQALASPQTRQQAISSLKSFLQAGANHIRYYEALRWLGELQLAERDFESARQTFQRVAQAPWNDYQLLARIYQGRILMAQDQPNLAEQEFEAVISSAGEGPGEQQRKYEAMLGKARALIQQSKHDEALKMLDEIIDKTSPEDTAAMAEAYILQGHAYQALNRPKEAVLAYLHVDVLFPRETGYHAEALYHLVRLWRQVQQPERSLDSEARLQSLYPQSEWVKRLGAGQAN